MCTGTAVAHALDGEHRGRWPPRCRCSFLLTSLSSSRPTIMAMSLFGAADAVSSVPT